MKKFLAALTTFSSPTAFAASSMGNFSVGTVVHDVIVFIVVAVVFGILYMLAEKAPWIPAWAKEGIKYFILFAAAIIVIGLLLGFIGYPIF